MPNVDYEYTVHFVLVLYSPLPPPVTIAVLPDASKADIVETVCALAKVEMVQLTAVYKIFLYGPLYVQFIVLERACTPELVNRPASPPIQSLRAPQIPLIVQPSCRSEAPRVLGRVMIAGTWRVFDSWPEVCKSDLRHGDSMQLGRVTGSLVQLNGPEELM